MTGPGAARVRAVPLLALAGVVTVLALVGVLPRWPGLLHVVALPPLDLVGDLGALLVHAGAWPLMLVGAAASVVLRSAVMAAVLGGLDRERFLHWLRFYLAVLPVAFVAAALLYGSKAVLFYALFWAGVAVSLVLVAVTAAAPWLGARLRRGVPLAARHGFRLGTVGAYLAVLAALGALADVLGEVAGTLLVPASGLATVAAARLLHADPGWRAVRRAVAAVPAAGIVALLAVAALGPSEPPTAEPPAEPRDGSVMLMSGIDSSSGQGAILEIDPSSLAWTCERTFSFSYAGPGDGQPRGDAACEIDHGAPYGPEDTLRSRDELVPGLLAQLEPMPPPITIAGHSQGVWLTWDAVTGAAPDGVDSLVLVGAFPENTVAYPAGPDRRAGHVGRLVVKAVADLPRPGGTTVFDPDSPLGVEWLADRHAVEEVLARPLPDGVRALSVTSAFDLPLMPGGHRIDGVVDACPVAVIHPNLPYAAEMHEVVSRFLDDEPLPPCAPWRRALGPLFRHFAVPPSLA